MPNKIVTFKPSASDAVALAAEGAATVSFAVSVISQLNALGNQAAAATLAIWEGKAASWVRQLEHQGMPSDAGTWFVIVKIIQDLLVQTVSAAGANGLLDPTALFDNGIPDILRPSADGPGAFVPVGSARFPIRDIGAEYAPGGSIDSLVTYEWRFTKGGGIKDKGSPNVDRPVVNVTWDDPSEKNLLQPKQKKTTSADPPSDDTSTATANPTGDGGDGSSGDGSGDGVVTNPQTPPSNPSDSSKSKVSTTTGNDTKVTQTPTASRMLPNSDPVMIVGPGIIIGRGGGGPSSPGSQNWQGQQDEWQPQKGKDGDNSQPTQDQDTGSIADYSGGFRDGGGGGKTVVVSTPGDGTSSSSTTDDNNNPDAPAAGDAPPPAPNDPRISGPDPESGLDDPTKRGDPDPDGDGSGSDDGKSTVPYGPPHRRTTIGGNLGLFSIAADRSLRARMLLERLLGYRTSGYASGDDWGAAGYNPRMNGDPGINAPDFGGNSQSSDGSGPSFGTTSSEGGNGSVSSGSYDPDNEWGNAGYNPHYQPWTGAHTPATPSAQVTRLTRVSRSAIRSGITRVKGF